MQPPRSATIRTHVSSRSGARGPAHSGAGRRRPTAGRGAPLQRHVLKSQFRNPLPQRAVRRVNDHIMPALLDQGADLDGINVTSADGQPEQADQDAHLSSIQSVADASCPGLRASPRVLAHHHLAHRQLPAQAGSLETQLSCRGHAPRGRLDAQFEHNVTCRRWYLERYTVEHVWSRSSHIRYPAAPLRSLPSRCQWAPIVYRAIRALMRSPARARSSASASPMMKDGSSHGASRRPPSRCHRLIPDGSNVYFGNTR